MRRAYCKRVGGSVEEAGEYKQFGAKAKNGCGGLKVDLNLN